MAIDKKIIKECIRNARLEMTEGNRCVSRDEDMDAYWCFNRAEHWLYSAKSQIVNKWRDDLRDDNEISTRTNTSSNK